MQKALIAVFLSILAGVSGAKAQPEEQEPQEVRVDHRTLELDGQTYAWSIMIPPGFEEGGAAILFLHGAGECGTDGEKNLAVGLPRHVREHPERWPFVVIVPQKPTMASEWEDHEAALLAMLDEAADDGLYEPAQLAITGLSQGGHGTIMIASMHPERFQAAAPVCGYVERRMSTGGERLKEVPATPEDEAVIDAATKLTKMPVWIFHGSLDDVVPPEESRSLAETLKKLDARVQFTEFEDANHNSWDAAYSNPELARWFVEQTKE